MKGALSGPRTFLKTHRDLINPKKGNHKTRAFERTNSFWFLKLIVTPQGIG